MYKFVFEEDTGVLRLKVLGLWTAAEIERFGLEANEHFVAARRSVGYLRLLIDCSHGFICPQDLVEPLAHAGKQYARDDDRMALIVNSSLMKMQVRRMMGDAPSNMFISNNAAVTWLTAHRESAVAA